MNKLSNSRFLLSTMVSASTVRMSTKSKAPSHYDTLEVNSRATQGEIKSAYFKLSKQYHPDKNKSEQASQKFRNISEAYEVLGNFNNRKVYDRSLIVNPKNEKQRKTSNVGDSKMKYYQTQAAIFKQDTKVGTTPIYDFDAWTRAHYGKTLQRNILDKKEGKRLREDRQDLESRSFHSASQDQSFLVVSILFIAALILLTVRRPRYDEYYLAVREKDDLQKNQISQESEVASNSVSSDYAGRV